MSREPAFWYGDKRMQTRTGRLRPGSARFRFLSASPGECSRGAPQGRRSVGLYHLHEAMVRQRPSTRPRPSWWAAPKGTGQRCHRSRVCLSGRPCLPSAIRRPRYRADHAAPARRCTCSTLHLLDAAPARRCTCSTSTGRPLREALVDGAAALQDDPEIQIFETATLGYRQTIRRRRFDDAIYVVEGRVN